MKKRIVVMFAVWLFTTCNLLEIKAQQVRDYVVVTSKKVQADGEWMKVVKTLAKRHKATVLYYDKLQIEVFRFFHHCHVTGS